MSKLGAKMESQGDAPGDTASKRVALAGQWRTPPLPAFASAYPHAAVAVAAAAQTQSPLTQQQQQQQQVQAQGAPPPQAAQSQGQTQSEASSLPTLPAPTTIPDNSEDYAKALQEAYRKGAEAAARMAQQQQNHQNIPTASSCPNFSTGPHAHAVPAPPPQPTGVPPEELAYTHQAHPTPTHSTIPDPLSSSMPPPPPPAPAAPVPIARVSAQHQHQHHSQHQLQHHHQAQQQPPPPQQQHIAKNDYVPTGHEGQVPVAKPSSQGRSLSLPDMTAYAAQAEEEKRQKRLARNRASARLRRLRKKNLVDAYETEVGILEKTLKQLKAHQWGKDDDHKSLLDALGMERGQQAIKPEQRTGIIQDILNQQMQQVQLLRQAQHEQEFLQMVASGVNDADGDGLCNELRDILQLTPSQQSQLLQSNKGLHQEIEALETVSASLQAMLDNEWLLNEGVQSITDQFTSILHKNQLSKFLLWTDANVEAIDQLDHVQVQELRAAPIFTFGVETTPVDDDEK